MLLELFLTAVQDPETEPAPTEDPRVILTGGIEAPARGDIVSTASISTLPRATGPTPKVGSRGRISARVGSLVGVRGNEENVISGMGLVTGLNGTGDTGELPTIFLSNLLKDHNVNIDPGGLKPQSLAVVRVTAVLPAGMKPGQKIDARVSTLLDSESLQGGELEFTELFDAAGNVVYATAYGPLNVGGYTVSGQAASATKNHPTVGTMPSGATIQREVPTSVVNEHGFIYLDTVSNHSTFGNVVRIADAINRLYPGAALVLPDGRSVRVAVPSGIPESQYVAFLDSLLRQEVETDNLARVVINERTGTIVMGGDVRLRPGVISHGSLMVTIAENTQTSQPGALSEGQTTTEERTTVDVVEEETPLTVIPGATSLEEVVEVLNVLGVSPRDMITILGQMSETGMLIAEIRRM